MKTKLKMKITPTRKVCSTVLLVTLLSSYYEDMSMWFSLSLMLLLNLCPGRERLKLKVENTIRWRQSFDSEGKAFKESNARIVR